MCVWLALPAHCRDALFLSIGRRSAYLAVFIASNKVEGLILSILGMTVVYQPMICLPCSPGVGWRGLVPWVSPKDTQVPGNHRADRQLSGPRAGSSRAAELGNSTLSHELLVFALLKLIPARAH